MLKKPEMVLIDVDGTLVDSFPVSILAANRYNKEKVDLIIVLSHLGYPQELSQPFHFPEVH